MSVFDREVLLVCFWECCQRQTSDVLMCMSFYDFLKAVVLWTEADWAGLVVVA